MTMKGGNNNNHIPFLDEAELSAREITKTWIQSTLRECFFQGLKRSWKLRPGQVMNDHDEDRRDPSSNERRSTRNNDDDNNNNNNKGWKQQTLMDEENDETSSTASQSQTRKTPCIVELSASDISACMELVQRLSKCWQEELRGLQHYRVAEWVKVIHDQGKSTLWADPTCIIFPTDKGDSVIDDMGVDNSKRVATEQNPLGGTEPTNRTIGLVGEDGDGNDMERTSVATTSLNEDSTTITRPPIGTDIDTDAVNPYCALRTLGSKIHQSARGGALSVPDALKQLKEFTGKNATYWPLESSIIDEAVVDMSRRTTVWGGSNNTGVGKDSASHYSASSSRGSQQSASRNRRVQFQTEDFGSHNSQREDNIINEENVSTNLPWNSSRKRRRTEKDEEIARPPWDISALIVPESLTTKTLTAQEKSELDSLVMTSENAVGTNSEVPLGLLGGLIPVGTTYHLLSQEDSVPNDVDTNENISVEDKVARRKRNKSIQERLDPHRLQQRMDNPQKIKSKFLRTEDWFDEEQKFFDIDLGWCLMEVETVDDNNDDGKRLCAFSSIEVSLEDRGVQD